MDESARHDAAPAAAPTAAPSASSPAERDGLSNTAPPAPAIAPATAPARAATGPLRHAATTAAQALPEGALGVPGDPPDAAPTGLPMPATRPTLAGPTARAPMASARSPAMTAPAPAAPSLRIGRIDVTVLADAPRAAPRADAGGLDPHFLSRHYLRRT